MKKEWQHDKNGLLDFIERQKTIWQDIEQAEEIAADSNEQLHQWLQQELLTVVELAKNYKDNLQDIITERNDCDA